MLSRTMMLLWCPSVSHAIMIGHPLPCAQWTLFSHTESLSKGLTPSSLTLVKLFETIERAPA